MNQETEKLKQEIDGFLTASSLEPGTIRALNAYAGVQAHLRAKGDQPNEDHLQQSRKSHILDRFKPIDPDDLDVQADLAEGLTIEDLESEADMFRNIALNGARWIAFALAPEVPAETDENSVAAFEKRSKVDEQLEMLNIASGLRIGLDVIAALKASVYVHGGIPTFNVFQEYRLYEIHNCFVHEPKTDRRRMLDQAAWVSFALESASR
jgi:hypothetical protein